MEIQHLRKLIESRILEDYSNILNLEKEYQKQIKEYIRLGLDRSESYSSLIEEKVMVSYYAAYLFRIYEIVKTLDDNLLTNISSEEMRIKRTIQMWKKNDIKNVRKMRKSVGNGGVEMMKKCINLSISKINEYVSLLGEGVRKL